VAFYTLAAVILLWQIVSLRGAVFRVRGGSASALIMLPFRLAVLLGLFGYVFLTPQIELLLGFSPVHAIVGEPHFWAKQAAKHGCTMDEDKFRLVCPDTPRK